MVPGLTVPDFRPRATSPTEVDRLLSGPATVLHRAGLALAFSEAFFNSLAVVARDRVRAVATGPGHADQPTVWIVVG